MVSGGRNTWSMPNRACASVNSYRGLVYLPSSDLQSMANPHFSFRTFCGQSSLTWAHCSLWVPMNHESQKKHRCYGVFHICWFYCTLHSASGYWPVFSARVSPQMTELSSGSSNRFLEIRTGNGGIMADEKNQLNAWILFAAPIFVFISIYQLIPAISERLITDWIG